VEIEFIDGSPPPNLNPHLNGPFDPLLILLNKTFSNLFYHFNNPDEM
jgi:hypothetical protein